VGVQSLPGRLVDPELPESERLLVFAFNTWSRHSNASDNVLYVDVDTRNCQVGAPATCRDNDPEYVVIGVDLGLALVGATNGVYVSLTIDLNSGALTGGFFADAPHNSSTVLLPTLSSSLGLKQTGGDADFEYTAFAECLFCDFPTFDVVTTGRSDQPQAGFHPWRPPVSQGDFIPMAPGASTVLSLAVDRAQFSKYLTKGWMIVTSDDPSGPRQAETMLAAPLP
jgi:minor extracellular serine protease Vpr